MYQTKVLEKLETHISFLKIPPHENCVVYEIMWKNTFEADGPQMTIWRTRNPLLIPKAKDIHSEM